MEIGDNKLKTNFASIGVKQAIGMEMGAQAMSAFAGTQAADSQEGRVVQLLNMVTAEELIDNDEYEGIFLSYSFSKAIILTRPLRNLRRRPRRMLEIRTNHRHENSTTGRRKSPVKWRGQDILEICGCRSCEKGVTESCGSAVCAADGCGYLF